MTYIPKHLQEAFRFTDKMLKNPDIAKALNRNAGTQEVASSSLVKEVTSVAVDLVNRSSSRKLNLSGFDNVEDLWKQHSQELKLTYPFKTEAEIKTILTETGGAHFGIFSGSGNENVGYILLHQQKIEALGITATDLQKKMSLLHELTHAIDRHTDSSTFKNALYLKKGQTLKRLSEEDLQNALNMIYIEEHAHGTAIKTLNQILKDKSKVRVW